MLKETAQISRIDVSGTDQRHIYTVSELTQDIKLVLETTLGNVWVEGEISNFRRHSSGHCYFSLKDANALLPVVMFRNRRSQIKFQLQDGLAVILFGRITAYGAKGQYQILAERLEPRGLGSLELAFQQLKNRLYKEGLFEQAHKRPLGIMPFRLGIVTSATGAAIEDILKILKRGADCLKIILRPSLVQGQEAPFDIVQAIKEFNRYKQVDVIILTRGGGSLEDLWAFNEEAVARAIYNSQIPVISAVGHEIDITISDLVADLRAETPSAVAKLFVDKRNQLIKDIDNYLLRLNNALLDKVNSLRHSLTLLENALRSPLDLIQDYQQRFDDLISELSLRLKHYLQILQERFRLLKEKLHTLGPRRVLLRGYSISLLMPTEAVLKDSRRLKKGDKVKTILSKGSFISKVLTTEAPSQAGAEAEK
jgi:exodeoxyribonuclease VII large subunit